MILEESKIMKKLNLTALLLLIILFSSCTQIVLPSKSNFTGSRGLGGVAVKTSKGNILNLYSGSYALAIGNSNYTNGWDTISGAEQDAGDVARVLRNHGFKTILKTNLTKEEFTKTINDFSIKYGQDENNQLLIYYAGHGYTEKLVNDEDLGYLVMVDAPLPDINPLGFSTKAVDMQQIITLAKKIRARHVLFMFDSCFSGTLLSMRDRVIPRSITDSVKYPVRQFITAGRANEKVPDHSVFKQAFLDLLEGRDKEPIPDGYITGEELGLYLKNKVPQYNQSQNPQYGKIRDPKLDKGDFVFVFNSANQWTNKQKAKELEKMIIETRNKKEEAEKKIADSENALKSGNKRKTSKKRERKSWFNGVGSFGNPYWSISNRRH